MKTLSNKTRGLTIPIRSLRRSPPSASSLLRSRNGIVPSSRINVTPTTSLFPHFTQSSSGILSRKKTKKTCLSPSLSHSSHTLQSGLPVPPSGIAPLFLVPSFGKLFLFPGNLSSMAVLSLLGISLSSFQFLAQTSSSRILARLTSARTLRTSALLASCSRVLVPCFPAIPTRAHKMRYNSTAFQNCLLIPILQKLPETFRTHLLCQLSDQSLFSQTISITHVKHMVPGFLPPPAGPPLPKPLTPRTPYKKVTG